GWAPTPATTAGRWSCRCPTDRPPRRSPKPCARRGADVASRILEPPRTEDADTARRRLDAVAQAQPALKPAVELQREVLAQGARHTPRVAPPTITREEADPCLDPPLPLLPDRPSPPAPPPP